MMAEFDDDIDGRVVTMLKWQLLLYVVVIYILMRLLTTTAYISSSISSSFKGQQTATACARFDRKLMWISYIPEISSGYDFILQTFPSFKHATQHTHYDYTHTHYPHYTHTHTTHALYYPILIDQPSSSPPHRQ